VKNLTLVRLFNDKECDQIIKSVEDNISDLIVSNMNGWSYLSAYEIDIKSLDLNIQELIFNKVKTFTDLKINQTYIIKYSKDLIEDMAAHYDGCSYSLPINLNNDFDGGGTYLPILKHVHKPQEHSRGVGVLFKSDKLNSWHKALPIKSGVRYTCVIKFDKRKNIFLKLLTIGKLIIATKIIEYLKLYKD